MRSKLHCRVRAACIRVIKETSMNPVDIILIVIIAAAAALALRSVIKRKKRGGCGCADCPQKKTCRTKAETEE